MITAWIIGIRERIVYPMRLRFRYFDFSDDFSLEGDSIDIGDGAIIYGNSRFQVVNDTATYKYFQLVRSLTLLPKLYWLRPHMVCAEEG